MSEMMGTDLTHTIKIQYSYNYSITKLSVSRLVIRITHVSSLNLFVDPIKHIFHSYLSSNLNLFYHNLDKIANNYKEYEFRLQYFRILSKK